VSISEWLLANPPARAFGSRARISLSLAGTILSERSVSPAGSPERRARVILAASTVAIVAIAAVIIVALIALIYIVPRGGRRRR
jgi:hypothetical protein